MSSKSSQHPHEKSGFSKKMLVIAVLIGIVFLTIIVIYPRIFSPSNIGTSAGPSVPTATQTK
jgi:hypothetical protein